MGPVTPTITPACLDQPTEPKDQKRCGLGEVCKKKLALSDFACSKCKTRYCGTHRLPELHKCPHDFMKEGKALLTKLNPQVVGDRLCERI
jgi:predicted nucleic acid binding AN1-type Zn finger protein